MKKLSVLLVCFLMAFTLFACGDDNTAPPAGNNAAPTEAASGNNAPNNNAQAGTNADGSIMVIIDVDFPDMSGQRDVDDMRINVSEGSSVLDVLNACAKQMGFEVTMDSSSSTPYVSAIAGVAANKNAGWMYEVNDRMPTESADKYIVQNGDDINWEFDSYYDD